MQVLQLLLVVMVALAIFAVQVYADDGGTRAAGCLPASCASFGCCSGDCGYWCRACGISYVC